MNSLHRHCTTHCNKSRNPVDLLEKLCLQHKLWQASGKLTDTRSSVSLTAVHQLTLNKIRNLTLHPPFTDLSDYGITEWAVS